MTSLLSSTGRLELTSSQSEAGVNRATSGRLELASSQSEAGLLRPSTGRLELFMGCMFSGKTSELIRQARRLQCIGRRVLFINHSFDRRYDREGEAQEQVFSHDQVSFPCLNVQRLSDVENRQVDGVDAIFVNEGQFFDDLREVVLCWVDQLGKDVYVGGLDGDSQRQKFGQLVDLVPVADAVHKLHAFCFECRDGTLAPFTHRVSNDQGQVVIGVSNYVALCRRHYLAAVAGAPVQTHATEQV
jgi:thymidine kinase